MTSEIPCVDVAGVGVNATDTILELPRFPAPDTKMEVTSSSLLAGGQVATAMVACANWGLRTRYIGKIGDDAAGELQQREFERAGVEAHLIVVKDCPSQSSTILVDQQTGERTILWYRDPRQALQPCDIRKEWVVSAKVLHVDGHDTLAATAAARWAHESGIRVTADLDNIYPGVEELLAVTDYPITSREFPARLTGENDLLKSLPILHRRFGCRAAGATLGREGALAWDGSQFFYSPAFQVAERDTTGAGDVFHAAFVYGLLQGWPISRLLDFGCAAAALNCTGIGARGGIRPVEEIEALRERGRRHPGVFQQKKLEEARLAT
ncbi:MAG TPA: PfkB family carbohydrate kinase [Candidatus Acidoferrales bacterium]|nr:PfkB family carbohydrate kinase [Candidatus Acidoferrales bacterium]